jgi:hypothetical protein
MTAMLQLAQLHALTLTKQQDIDIGLPAVRSLVDDLREPNRSDFPPGIVLM